MICQQQGSNSFSLGEVNANNNSCDSGNGIMLERVTFHSWLSPFPPFPKDILPNNRITWFIPAHVSCGGSWDHTVWMEAQVCVPVAIITKEVFFFKKKNIKWYICLLLKPFSMLWRRLALALGCQSKLGFNKLWLFYYYLHCPWIL